MTFSNGLLRQLGKLIGLKLEALAFGFSGLCIIVPIACSLLAELSDDLGVQSHIVESVQMLGDDLADVLYVAFNPHVIRHAVLDAGDQSEGEFDHFYVILLAWWGRQLSRLISL